MSGVACYFVEAGLPTKPVFFDTDMWKASLEWAEFHGIDTMSVPGGSEIVRDVIGCRVRYTTMLLDRQDNPIIVGDELVTAYAVAQGEAPPLPFPS